MTSLYIAKKFGRNLRRLRFQKDLSQESLAKRAGLSVKYLQRMEGKNPSSLSLHTVFKIAKGLGVHPSGLVSFDRKDPNYINEQVPNWGTL